jgi:phosphopantothenoylcysteine decarboxylase/phosphopantothenate--cysteine ligase
MLMPHYVLFLRQHYVNHVRVMMSRAAQYFVTPYSMRLYTGNWVFTDSFQMRDGVRVPHVELTRAADLFLVMPADANVIGKAAGGICDDLISTAVVASPVPVVFVPSMNERMWFNPVVQANVGRLREAGYHVLEPGFGLEVADTQAMYGVMRPLPEILAEVREILQDLAGMDAPVHRQEAAASSRARVGRGHRS